MTAVTKLLSGEVGVGALNPLKMHFDCELISSIDSSCQSVQSG